MKTYLVQIRYRHDGALCTIDRFRARSAIGAIAQAVRMLQRCGDDAVEFVATEQGAAK